MAISINEAFLENREEVNIEISKCATFGGTLAVVGSVFAILGVIADAIDTTLGLEPTSWLLLGIFLAVVAMGPLMHSVFAKHLHGMESERRPEQ